jgi:rhamnosyltransferase
MNKDVLISVVIPVKNGEYWLRKTIEAIIKQTVFEQCEIIIIDSGSTDSTLEIVKQYPVHLIQIQPQEFNHGATRNIGALAAKGTYVVMTVQDAQAADEYWLEHLLNEFADEEVVAVCGKQIVPHVADANPIYWHRPFSAPQKRSVQFKDEAFQKLAPVEQKQACALDDVNTMYKKEKLLELPFRKVLFGEDMQWAKDALQKGWKLVYTDFAVVHHHHTDTPSYAAKRTYTECFYRYKLFACKYQPTSLIQATMRDAKILLKTAELTLLKKAYWLWYNLRIHISENRAIRQFNEDLKKGETLLEQKFYHRLGNISPQASAPLVKQ